MPGGMFTSLGDIQAAVVGVDAALARWAGLEEQTRGGLLAVVCSLAAVWISWKVVARCLWSVKLRRLSRTVPSIR